MIGPVSNPGNRDGPIDHDDLTLPEARRRELARWAVSSIERLLPLFRLERPDDARPRDAMEALRAFADGDLGVAVLRRRAAECHAAARDATSPVATAIARAAGQAAALAHMAAHSRQVARYTARALDGDKLETELAWQRDHVPAALIDYVYR